MIDLGLNQNKIKEIKYEVKEGKTVIFKLQNSNLEDVEIVIKSPYSRMTDDEKQEYIEKLRRTETAKTEESVENKNIVGETESNKKEIDLKTLMSETKAKELHDYEPFSCLKKENGMQETLESSRKKEWVDSVKKYPNGVEKECDSVECKMIKSCENKEWQQTLKYKPFEPTNLENTILYGEIIKMARNNKSDNEIIEYIKNKHFIIAGEEDEERIKKLLKTLRECSIKYIINPAKKEEIKDFKDSQDKQDKKFTEEIKSKKDEFLESKKMYEEEIESIKNAIKNDAKKDSDIIKERNEDRTQERYFHGDPNDEYSKIKSFGDVDVEKTEFVDFLKDKPVIPKNAKEFLTKNGMKYIGQMKIDRKTDEIIDFKPNDNNKSDE